MIPVQREEIEHLQLLLAVVMTSACLLKCNTLKASIQCPQITGKIPQLM